MRNLKRVLSLTLASVMLLGMMVVGASAADFSDVDYAEDNVEAIEVLDAINVMRGDADGNGNLTGEFRPGDPVSRAEMARIMASLLALDYQYYIGNNPFTDMDGHWAEGYAAACAANGIIAGRTTTTYDPSATVTTVEAAAMLMRALGYFQNWDVDYADGFEIATIRQAGRIDLFNKVDTKTNEAMTRNDVAQLVLNTLKSGMVEPDNGNKVSVTVGDAQVTVGATNYVYVVSREKYASSIRDDKGDNYSAGDTTGLRNAYIVDLGEKLYQGDLTRASVNDDLGRPAQHWEYKTKDIGTYADEPDYAFTSKVTSKKLYDTIGAVASEYKTWQVYINGTPLNRYDSNDNLLANSYTGATLRNNRVDDDKCFLEKAGIVLPHGKISDDTGSDSYTDNGVVTEIYVDDTVDTEAGKGTVTIAVYNLYAAEVMRVIESDGTIVLTDLDAGPATAADEYKTTLFDEDDIVIYTYSMDAKKIQAVALAERVEGEITRVRTGTASGDDDNRTGDLFVVDGKTYNYNATVSKGHRLQTETVNNNMVGYLDEFGYCVYIDQAAVSYDYAYVLSAGTDNDRYGADIKGQTIYARLAFTDGTTASVETDNAPGQWYDEAAKKVKFEHMIVSYSVDKNGIYTLTPAKNYVTGQNAIMEDAPKLEIKHNVSSFDGANGKRYSANSNTIFVLVTSDEDSYSNYSFSTYTGVGRVPDVDGNNRTNSKGEYIGSRIAVATEIDSRVAKAVFVLDGNVSGGDVYFIRAKSDAKLVRDSEIGDYYEINAYVDGEAVTLKVKSSSSAADALVKSISSNTAPKLPLGDGKSFIYAADAITENADGLVTGVHFYGRYEDNTDGDGVLTGVGTDKTSRNVIILGKDTTGDKLGDAVKERFTYEPDAVFVQWVTRNNNSKFETSRANAIKNDNNDEYIVVTDGDVITGICVKYVENGEGKFKWTDEDDGIDISYNRNGGTVTYNVDGTTVTVTVTPKQDYQVDKASVKVLDSKGNALPLSWAADNSSFTFTLPADGIVNGSVTFVEAGKAGEVVLDKSNLTEAQGSAKKTENADGTVTITVTPKAPYNYIEILIGDDATYLNNIKNPIRESDTSVEALKNKYEYVISKEDVAKGVTVKFNAEIMACPDPMIGWTHLMKDVNGMEWDVRYRHIAKDGKMVRSISSPDVTVDENGKPQSALDWEDGGYYEIARDTGVTCLTTRMIYIPGIPEPVEAIGGIGHRDYDTDKGEVKPAPGAAPVLTKGFPTEAANTNVLVNTKDGNKVMGSLLTLGEPKLKNAKLPTEVVVDGMVQFTITWECFDKNGDKVDLGDGQFAIYDPNSYTYKAHKVPTFLPAAEEKGIDENFVMVVEDIGGPEGEPKTIAVKSEYVEAGLILDVDDKGELDVKYVDEAGTTQEVPDVKTGDEAEAIIPDQPEPEAPKEEFTVTANSGEGYTVTVKNASGTETTTFKDGDTVTVTITLGEKYRLKSVKAGSTDVTEKTELKVADWVYTFTITENTVITVEVEEIKELVLTLKGVLANAAMAENSKISVVADNALKTKTVQTDSTGAFVVRYSIPENAKVQVISRGDSTVFSTPNLFDGVDNYLVGDTVVGILYTEDMNGDGNPDPQNADVRISFDMTKDLILDMSVANTLNPQTAKKVHVVKSVGGVTAEFTGMVDKTDGTSGTELKTYELKANGTVVLPYYYSGTTKTQWTVKVTGAGSGTNVSTGSKHDWTIGQAQPGAFPFTGEGVVTFYSCFKVDAPKFIEVTGDHVWWEDGPGHIGTHYVPVGEEITVKYRKEMADHGNSASNGAKMPATMKELGVEGFLVVGKSDAASGLAKTSVIGSATTEKATVTVTEPMIIYIPVKFTLGAGVSATYTYSDPWTGTKVEQTLPAGTKDTVWYAVGDVWGNAALESEGGTLKANQLIRGLEGFTLVFDNNIANGKAVVAADLKTRSGYDAIEDYFGNATGDAEGRGDGVGFKVKVGTGATTQYVTEARPWNGAKFEAWTVVKTKDIDEAYVTTASTDKGSEKLVFDNAYAIRTISAAKVTTTDIRMDNVKVASASKTVFIDPNLLTGSNALYLMVYGGNGERGSSMAENGILNTKYNIVMSGATVVDADDPYIMDDGIFHTAFGAFKNIPTGVLVSLEAVLKSNG